MEVVQSFTGLPLAFKQTIQDKYSVAVYGSFFADLETIDFSKAEHDPKILNLDGEYFLVYTNLSTNRRVFFRSHVDSFSVYYFVKNDTLHFSDDLFQLLTHFETVSWNRQALADYFESGWNNIQKNENTPFCEIKKLAAGTFMTLSSHSESKDISLRIATWKHFEKSNAFTMGNLEEFKDAYITAIRHYLTKTIDSKTAFTVSGGIDSSTLAILSSKWFSSQELSFYSTRFNDDNDESCLTRELNAFISSDVEFIDVEPPSEFINRLKELIRIVQSPYTDIEGITHFEFFKKLKSLGVTKVVTGLGADLTFGGTPHEYPLLVHKLIHNGQIVKAYHVFLAHKSGLGVTFKSEVHAYLVFLHEYLLRPKFLRSFIRFGKKIMKKISRNRPELEQLLFISIPEMLSSKIKSYEDGLNYSYSDAAPRQLSALQRACNISPIHPFEGSKFAELSNRSHPYIFANRVNKFALRNSMREVLPQKILENKQKFGNGGYESRLIEENRDQIISYLKNIYESGQCSIVDVGLLIRKLQSGEFTDTIFRCINVVLYEDILEHELHVTVRQ